MKPRFLGATCGCAFALAVSLSAHAASISGQGTWETTLQARDLDGNLSTAEAYYDTVLNITWLSDANYITNDPTGVTGAMNWPAATTWAANLNPYDSGITGWRLPTTIDVGNDGSTYTNIYQGVDYGYNNTTHSEMSYLSYVTLGNQSYYTTSGDLSGCPLTSPVLCFTNTGPFANGQSSYWSATENNTSATVDANNAWFFNPAMGFQGIAEKTGTVMYAWAVHSGDIGIAVTTSTVPVPAAVWLFGSGLLGLIGMARRKRA